ncbi:SET domain-containing protein [Xylariaceae sp. FL0255]|nr:SET domain-containing protein [Xylariaceae sp. FL0255]
MAVADLEFGQKSASFLKWFRALPGATFHSDIEIQDFRDRAAGRGIVAAADIPQDTVLFTIPRNAIINTQTSDLAKRIPDLFATTGLDETSDNEADDDGGETSGPPDNWISLILVMIYEYLQGAQSRWQPYFGVLPTNFETLIWWSDNELEQLQASSIISKIGKDDADAIFRVKVLPVIDQHPEVFYPAGSQELSEAELIHLAHRMGSIIMAYAFDLEGDEEDADRDEDDEDDEWVEDKEGKILMGMVPMADILNADAEFNAHVNHEEDSLSVTAIKPIRAGEEILNYYGPLGNGELLRRYGYVTDHHSRYDVIELSWESVLLALKTTLNLDESTWERADTELDPEEIEDAFVVDRDLDEPDSQGSFQGEKTFKHLPEDLREQINAILKCVRKLSPETIPDKQKRDEICYTTMRRAFEQKLAEYQTSASDDQKLLSGTPRYCRATMAAVVRHGEKLLLQEAINLANEKLNGLKNGDQQPSAKRSRIK